MLKLRLAAVTAVLAVLATLSITSAQGQAKSQDYVLSGANGNGFSVDDDFVLQVNGIQIYNDGTALSGLRPKINFTTSPGATLNFAVHDTYGFCNGLDPLFISCKGSSTYTPVTQGLPETCGFPGGNNGTVFSGSYTIPTTLPGCAAVTIASVEITQAIQQYQSLSELKASLTASGEPPVPIISNKPAVLRIYFDTVTDATPVSIQLYGVNSENKSITLQPNCSPTDQRAGNNGCQSLDFYFTPPSGSWNAELVLSDQNGVQLDDENLVLKSRDTSSVIMRGVGACILYTSNKPAVCGNGSLIAGLSSSAANLFPTASVQPVYAFGSLSEYLTDSPAFYIKSIAQRANARYGIVDSTNDYATNSYTTFLGIYDSAALGDTSGIAAGMLTHGATIPDHGKTLGIDNGADEAAHETAHTLNLFHTGTIVPYATTPPGCYNPAPLANFVYPFADNDLRSGNGIEYGFNVSTQTILNGNNTFDLMGYCTPQWITPFNYKRLIATLNGGAVTSPSAIPVHAETPVDTPIGVHPRTPPPAPVQGAYWQLSGPLTTATPFALDPVFLQTTYGTSDPGTGTYSLQVLDPSGKPLYTRAFTPDTTITDPAFGDPVPAAEPDLPYFSQWIPYTAGAASFAVIDPTGATLATLPIAGVAPTVVFTNPAGAFTPAGFQTITWTITDPDSTSFTSRLLYSPDNGVTWYQVTQTSQAGTKQGSGMVDFSTLPGASAALLRVYVTDGVNTGVATTAPFSAPRHLPSSITITTPANGTTQAAANPVYLTGSAFDADDGFLTGKALVWTSDLQGALGTGSPLSVTLKPGTHTLTLTATDSDGNVLTATTKITLGGAAPTLSLTTTASGACTTATITAAPGAQGAPLSLVQYSLDGGMTYTNIPLTALPFSLPLTTTGGLEIVARAYDASKQYAAQSTHVTLATGCVTQTLNALSGSGQTTVVGTVFPVPVVAQVVDSNGKGVAGISVTFTGPSSGAAAAFTTPIVTASDGTATIMPIANSVLGTYTITASAPSIASTAAFTIANTDYYIAASSPNLYIMHGTAKTETITLTALGGFNSTTGLSCTGLPVGVTCSFSPATITPTGGTASSTLTVNAANAMSARLGPPTHPGWSGPGWGTGVITLCGLFGFFTLGRRRRLTFVLTLLLTAALLGASGCGGFQGYSSTVTINASTTTATRTATITVYIQ